MVTAAILKMKKIVISQNRLTDFNEFGMMMHFGPLNPSDN